MYQTEKENEVESNTNKFLLVDGQKYIHIGSGLYAQPCIFGLYRYINGRMIPTKN